MLAASLDRDRRRPVWGVLSELFLDTELRTEDHRRIARVLASSGYSRGELEAILGREVGPVLASNLRSPAGEWAGFDLDRLEAEILRSTPLRWFARRRWEARLNLVRRDWTLILLELPPESSGPATVGGEESNQSPSQGP